MVATPLVVLFMTMLLNRRDVMGEARPRLWENFIYSVVFLFTLVMAVIGILGLFRMS